MAYYRVCPDCGCHLDPGESCDCQIYAEKAAPAGTGTTLGESTHKQYIDTKTQCQVGKGRAS